MQPKQPAATRTPLGDAAMVLGILGLLPIPGFAASVAALVCGYSTGSTDERARAGIILGWIGVAAPIVLLGVYCLVLGNPFPIHRYHPSR